MANTIRQKMNAKHELILNIVIGVTDYLPSISNMFNSNSKEKNSTYGFIQIISNPAGATITSGAVVGIFVSGIATGLAIAAVVGLGATTYICYNQMNTMKTQITETAHREHHKQPTGCVN
jgi:hypothetical protein